MHRVAWRLLDPRPSARKSQAYSKFFRWDNVEVWLDMMSSSIYDISGDSDFLNAWFGERDQAWRTYSQYHELDTRIHIIPIINENKSLQGIIYMSLQIQRSTYYHRYYYYYYYSSSFRRQSIQIFKEETYGSMKHPQGLEDMVTLCYNGTFFF